MCSNGPLALVAAAADQLDLEDLDAVDDASLAAQVRALAAAANRLTAQLSRRVAVFDDRGGAGRDGARSIRDWLRHRLRIDGTDAARHATVARALADLPVAARAYRRGEISLDHLAAIAEARWMLGETRTAETILVDRARLESPGRVRRLARRLRERSDPRAGLDAIRQARDARWFEAVRTASGSLTLRGQLDPGDGELMLAALAAQDVGGGDGVRRTPTQRNADALVAACRVALRADLRHVGDRPRVVVTVPLSVLQGAFGSDATLSSGEPVTAEAARRWACDARLVPAVLGSASEPLDVGAETETVSQGLRRALELRDRGCRFPGCDRPGGECEAHYLRHWADEGPSTVDNLVLLCPHHHVLTHEGGWSVLLDGFTREVKARRPDGTRLDAVSPPPD